ncbi:myb-like protein X isoform X4 [Drosophila tropicalis]|uniref:myb-like protein X isoform X4 n=1 Tax=Drosophila tropicalis TaxID=46794 RepID=UPI0035ABED5E
MLSHFVVAFAALHCIVATSHRPAYSLQAAVDELHRREAAKYPLNSPPTHFAGEPLDDWNEDIPSSVFREREHQAPSFSHTDLTDQFLREIEEASEDQAQEQDQDHKHHYGNALRQWWHRFKQQQQQAAVADRTDDADDDDDALEAASNADVFEQKKRMRMPPYYLLMQKKRSYPVLPWLPYNADKKKRFPVAKRAIGKDQDIVPGKTDERVVEELSELFGKPAEAENPASAEKKKRSAEESGKSSGTTSTSTTTTTTKPADSATATALGDMRLEINFQRVNVTSSSSPPTGELVQHGGHAGHHAHVAGMAQTEYHHRKRSEHVHHSNEDSSEHDADEHDEEGEESSDEGDHDEFDDEEGEGDANDEDERRKKKKRSTKRSPSVGHLMLRAKKSIDWSQYFGLDRKKKSLNEAQEKKRSESDNDDNDSNVEKRKRDLDPEKLENLDKKLQSIEDFIIDETIKYTGAHEGAINSKEEIRKIKDHVLSRLATAYSLEKMRRALDKLRQSVEAENHLQRNIIDPTSSEEENNGLEEHGKLNLAYIKHKADELAESEQPRIVESKKKRSGYLRYPEQPNNMEEALTLASNPYEPLNDAYLGNKNYIIGSNQCPIIESMAERCRGVDLISGDLNQELLPLCGVHQICYLCGASQVACDYQYLAEADSLCGNSNDCQSAARSVLMILRSTPGPQIGPRECLKNPCLYRAMREIGL